MKKTRWALLTLLVLAVAAVVAGYYVSQKRNALLAPVKPALLPRELHSLANGWTWSHSAGNRPVVEARAKDFRQIKDSSHFELAEVEFKIFSKTGDAYDLVQSQRADFDQENEKLYSDGEVTIVLGLPPAGPEPGHRYVEIHTSGLTYDSKKAVSSTDRPVRFLMPQGEGSSVGAEYDSMSRRLWLKSEANLLGAPNPARGGERLHVRAGELFYHEVEQKIELRPWSSVERGAQGIKGTYSTVYLQDGDLKKVETQQGEGFDVRDGREVRFAGDLLEMNYGANGAVTDALSAGHARLVSRSAAGVDTITGGRVDLQFTLPAGALQSELTTAFVRDQARIENVPAAPPSGPRLDTRVLTADWIKVTMRPGGEEIQRLETLSAGRLEMLPHDAARWKRTLTAERLSADYGSGNRPESMHAVNKVHLRSDPPAGTRLEPRLTWSDNLEASFDPETGQMRELHQWTNFRYQEGARQATAGGARFDVPNDRTLLQVSARVWDPGGVTTADTMTLDQKENHFVAEGHVTSTHRETRPAGAAPASGPEGMFASSQPVHAVAQRMESWNGNRRIEYRGSARLWQEGSSVQAEEIRVDREARSLAAKGRVTSILVDGQDDKDKQKPRVVTIYSDEMAYSDGNRRALYTGNVRMLRDRMTVNSGELEAFLRPEGEAQSQGQSRLERATARGKVDIREAAAVGVAPRKAAAEIAEYFSGEEKVILRGGRPKIEQAGRGSATGAELTYYLDDGRLQVSGRPGERAETHHQLKR